MAPILQEGTVYCFMIQRLTASISKESGGDLLNAAEPDCP